MKKLEEPMRSAVSGALDRSQRNRRPRHAEIDRHRTIRASLRHWQPEYRTVVAQTLHGYGRKARRPQREVVLCIDQSGSMAQSVVYSSIFSAVMASLPAMATRLAALGVPSFACAPDAFPGLMAAAIRREHVGAWAAARGMVVSAKER